ncbi:hypothetical protein ACFXB3_04745 [Streptomyces sp. NPDC059447]|uniref:hypothetical protein n=1 Tax=Streptomyces sp. NPDC059447 TaxID=3346834 RepID=UPI00369204D6
MRLTYALPVPVVALTVIVSALAGCGSTPAPPAPPAAVGITVTAPVPAETNPAGDIPDNQAYITYGSGPGAFTLKVPEGWARTEAANGDVTFTDKLNRITMHTAAAAAPATAQSVNASVVPALRGQVPGFSAGKTSTVTRPAGRAVLYTYRGNGPADPVTGKTVRDSFERYAFFHAGHETILTLSGPVGADNVDPWHTVTDSLRWQ